MCGICGFVNSSSFSVSYQHRILRKMTEAISYRGPDDQGLEVISNCGFGNRRLAVIDLSPRAHQPMWDSKKRYCLTYNGEVYNFSQLRKNLEKKGYHFFSQSDTEVIIALYQEYGPAAVKKLRGMFAFAIWDNQRQELFLARDHFGIKPLFYYWKDGVLVFASEIKSILLHPQVKRELNLVALSQYFSVGFGAIPSPNSIFKNIYKLPPAHYAILRNGRLLIKKYWYLENIEVGDYSFVDAQKRLFRLLSDSVKEQLISDVSLGAFLSGGIDSSTIVALMSKQRAAGIKTFSISFDDPNFDESLYSQRVAKIFKTNHFSKTFAASQLLRILPQVIEKLDEPLADASILPTYLLSQFTREKVTVALSGDGGDELFAGYPTYFAHKIASLISFFPQDWFKKLTPLVLGIAPFFPLMKHSSNLSSQFKIKRFFFGFSSDLGKRYINFLGPLNISQKLSLFVEPVIKEIGYEDPALVFINQLLKEVFFFDQQKKLQYLDLKVYLAEQCLVKIDRASSFNSLEVRVPFLNPTIAEFAFSLPSSFHFNGFTLKRLLKSTVRCLLPKEIINRPKRGFGVPINYWLRQDLKPMMEKFLSEKRLKRQGLFNPNFVQQLIIEHLSGKETHHMILWSLLIFQLWYDNWFKS